MSDKRSEIPKTFSLREQAIVVHQTAKMREDFIQTQRGKGKMSDEDMNLQAYNVAVLYAAAQTLKGMHAERKSTKVEEPPPAPVETLPPEEERMVVAEGDDGF